MPAPRPGGRPGVPAPVTILLPIPEIDKLLRKSNQQFMPRAIIAPIVAYGKTLTSLAEGLFKTVIKYSQTFGQILEPILTVLGLLADVLIIALLPYLKDFFSSLGRNASQLVRDVRAAGENQDLIGSAISHFIGRFALDLAILAEQVIKLLEAVVSRPEFWAVITRIITLATLGILNGVLRIGTAILEGINSFFTGTSGTAYSGLDKMIHDQAAQIGPNLKRFVTQLWDTLMGAGAFIWDLLKEVLRQVLKMFFPAINEGLSEVGKAFDFTQGRHGISGFFNDLGKIPGRARHWGWSWM